MAHAVFISYSKHDKTVADATCAHFEARNIRCWIAPRDVLAGKEYADAILTAINDCRIMVLIFSGNSNASIHIHKEVERAVSKGKIIVSFRIQQVVLSKSMEYYLSDTHWLDAMTPPLATRIDELAVSVERLLAPASTSAGTTPIGDPTTPSRNRRVPLFFALFFAFLLLSAISAVVTIGLHAANNRSATPKAPTVQNPNTPSPPTNTPASDTSMTEGLVNIKLVDASLTRERVMQVDQGQGFGSLIQSVRSKWRDAEIARLGHDWTQAVSACDAIMEVGRRIDALDVKRKKTMAARTAVEAARQNALTAHADTLVTNLWQTVAREANRADTLFEEGQFDAANEIWAALGSQWNELRDKAQDICAFNAATNAYESAWARVRTPDDYKAENTIGPEPSDARRSYLAQLSGPVWQELTEQERIAKNSCTNFEARRLAYERAVPLLDKASSLAAVNFKNRERCERTNQAHATEQQIPIVSNHFAADMAVRPPRLLIATRADGHELSGAGVWLSGISDSWRTPAQIDLKHGVHYEFSLSNSQQNAIEFLPAKLVIDANWNGDSNVCVNLMTRKPELPSPDREDDHLYFSRGSLTSQSQLDPSLFVKSHKRFINTGPNLLSDTLLAKTWVLYNPNEIMTFNNARSYASTQNGRLPTLRELSSLLVLRQNETDWARLNGAFFPKHMRSPRFWAEETGFLNLSLLCRFVDFGDGTTGKISPDDQCAVLVIRD